jgi:UPF0271 protein
MKSIDLNADVGEGIGPASVTADAALLALVSSANISCGAHAGDEETILAVIDRAIAAGCALGAHPSFLDREHFGRREQDLPPAEIQAFVAEQVAYLKGLCQQRGGTLRHVKPHGALYNIAARSEPIAAAIVAGIKAVDPRLIIVGLAGGRLIDAALQAGMHAAREAFADRAYQDDGALAPRSLSGAVHHDPAQVVAQVRQILAGSVLTLSGAMIPLAVETICLHGDTPGALEFARRIHTMLTQEGYIISGTRLNPKNANT